MRRLRIRGESAATVGPGPSYSHPSPRGGQFGPGQVGSSCPPVWGRMDSSSSWCDTMVLHEAQRMSIAPAKVGLMRIGPRSAGLLLTPEEFDRAEGVKGWRYELINGVLVVSPTPSRKERTPNDYLGYCLWTYREQHPQGAALDVTAPEEEIETRQGQDRRRMDRAIWAGLGRDPEEGEVPTIAVEFVSSGKKNQDRDYIVKRAEFREIGVKQ